MEADAGGTPGCEPWWGPAGAVAAFALALSVASVAVPLLIVGAGYSTASVGVLIALSAVTQMAVRFRIGAVLRRVADKDLVGAAAVLMAVGAAVLLLPLTLPTIVASQLLQGAARGFFWTGVQTHAVRTGATAARGLAAVNLASGVGLVAGPPLAGLLLEISASAAMALAAAAAAVGLLPVALMARLPVFSAAAQTRGTTAVSRRPEVRAGSWGSAAAGGWQGVMSAYVPVLLAQAGSSSTFVGATVGAANAATIAAGWFSRFVPSRCLVPGTAIAIAVTGLGLAVFALGVPVPALAGAALVASGLGMGALQTLGPAAAAEAVAPNERGDAMAAVGLYRAGASFAAPLGVAALVLVLPLGWALAVAGAAIAAPAITATGRGRR